MSMDVIWNAIGNTSSNAVSALMMPDVTVNPSRISVGSEVDRNSSVINEHIRSRYSKAVMLTDSCVAACRN